MKMHMINRIPVTNRIVYFPLLISALFLLPIGNSQSLIPTNNFNYNQVCVHASQCNNLAGLYCIPTLPSGQLRCGCPTNNTVFDEYQGRCVGKVGHKCIYQGNQSYCPEKAHCSHQDPHHPDLYYYEPRCFCDVNYFADKQGKCILAAKFQESCTSGKKCDEVSGLVCLNGKCSCKFGIDEQYFDTIKQRCVSYVSKRCSGYYSCVENARCEIAASRTRAVGPGLGPSGRSISGSAGGGIGISNIKDGARRSGNDIGNIDAKTPAPDESIGKCICEYGFSETKDKKCLAGYRQPCSVIQICNPEADLECLDGSCNCKSPLHQIYDHDKRKCLSLVGARCDANLRNSSSCIDSAFCNQGICTCKPGFSKTPFRRCMLDYEKSCENSQCNMYNGLTCDPRKKCKCVDDSLIYNEQIQACVSRVGSPCGKINQAGDYGKESFYVSCEPLAFCKAEPGGDLTTSFCRLPQKEL